MNYTEFETKVKSMTAHDIIMAMVEGLRSPRTEIDMGTFGEIKEGICFGCAATNAILHIMEAKEEEAEKHILARSSLIFRFPALYLFEAAIDWLRIGRVDDYNYFAAELGFAPITPMPGQELPYLRDEYTEEQLEEYVELAKYQLAFNQ